MQPNAPANPTPPGNVTVKIPGPDGTLRTISATPQEAYRAAVTQRDEVSDQVSSLVDKRDDVAQELSQAPAAVEPGLRTRLAELDQQVLVAERALAQANERVAQLAGVPGAIVERSTPPRDNSGEIASMMIAGSVALLFPIAIAYARRMWRRAAVPPAPAVPPELVERMGRIEQAVDAVAIEIERMSEGQRFVTRLLADESRAIPGGAAAPVAVPARDAVPLRPER